MMRWIIMAMIPVVVCGSTLRELSFQIYVLDTEVGAAFQGNGDIQVETSIVAENTDYFRNTRSVSIVNGVLNTSVSFDLDNVQNLGVFDMADVQLHVVLTNNDMNDEIFIPLSASPLAILSQLTDRALQLVSPNIMTIDYDNKVLQFGGSTGTKNAVNINGTLTADSFVGDGYLIYNVRGSGLNDDHSLEKFGSRTCSPDKQFHIKSSPGGSLDNCLFGEDVLFISNNPYVGIHMTHGIKDKIVPQMPFDVAGRVFFMPGENDVGRLTFPLPKNESIMTWDHTSGTFKAGYVSRDASVQMDTFSRSAVSIGRDIATYGLNSSVFGGQGNSIMGNYSAIVGGKDNQITGNYSILVGSSSDAIHKAYVATIGGENNQVSSNYSVLLASKNNRLSGKNHAVFGHDNWVNGDGAIVYGDNHRIDADRVIVMGDSTVVDHSNAWVINMSSTGNAKTTQSNQVVWFSDHGVSVNTSNASEMLVADGDFIAEFFYGDGSQLTNLSKLDKYWLMYGDLMTIADFKLGIKTNVGLHRQNRMYLDSGLRLGSDGGDYPGTLSYEHGDLIGYGRTSTASLLAQDTNTIYEVSSEFQKIDNTMQLVSDGVLENTYMVFNGSYWEPSQKTLWDNTNPAFASYSRPVTLWNSQNYLGRLTLSHPKLNALVFKTNTNDHGLTVVSSGRINENYPIHMGFNISDSSVMSRFNTAYSGFLLTFRSMDEGGYIIKSTDHPSLMHLNSSGKVSFFADTFAMDVNIPKKSRIGDLVIDPLANGPTELAHILFEDTPFFRVDTPRTIELQAANAATINFKLKKQARMQITNQSELLLSHDDRFSLGQPMVTAPEGDMQISRGRHVGVFDADRTIQTGVLFNHDSVVLIPESSQKNNVVFRHQGVGIRSLPQRMMVINDADVTNVLINKSQQTGASFLKFSRYRTPQWAMKFWNEGTTNMLDIRNSVGTRVLQFSDVLNIQTPVNPGQEINIKGNLAMVGNTMYLMGSQNPDVPGNSEPVAIVSGNQLVIQPVNQDQGIEFYANQQRAMSFNRGRVSIGVPVVPETPTQSVYVHQGTYIKHRLFLNNDNIDHKTFVWRHPISGELKSFKHHKDNTIQRISFDYDTGFDIVSTRDYVVQLTFQEHFSSFNGLLMADVLPEDETMPAEEDPADEFDDTPPLGPQIIVPNGIDSMSFDGEGVSITANNVVGTGDPSGGMDFLQFFNDLMNGGDIDGDLSILGTLNVIYNYRDPAVVPFKLRGDISDVNVESIQFPWRHRVFNGDTMVDYEYVITENVGIGLSNPSYPLEVIGVTSFNIVESPSINVTGNEFWPQYDDLNILSKDSHWMVTVNAAQTQTQPYLQLSNMAVQDSLFTLNHIGHSLTHVVNIFPVPESNNANMYIQGKQKSSVVFLNAMTMTSDSDGDFSIKSMGNVDDVIFISKLSSVFVSKKNGMGVGNFSAPKNTLDVSGNMVIGTGLSGVVAAPQNSVMVQHQLGISTANPVAMTDVQGFSDSPAAMVVGTSSEYLGSLSGLSDDLVIESHLFVEEYDANTDDHVLVNGAMVAVGGLYFNKKPSEQDTEWGFFNHPTFNRMVIGYGSNVNDRFLNVSAQDYIEILPNRTTKGLYIDNFSNVALGHNRPLSRFHVIKPSITLQLEAVGTGDAHILFDSDGVGGAVGISRHLPGHFRLSDGRNPDNYGDVLSIDTDGQVDIAYNVVNQDTPQPSHNVKMDVLGNVNATTVKKNNTILTHMPEGSIIMWSGWSDDLPDGWLLCTGMPDTSDHPKTTDKCSMQDYFVVGKKPGDKWGNANSVGAHTFSATTEGKYDHEHVGSDHTHTEFTETGAHTHSGSSSDANPNKKIETSASTGYNLKYEKTGQRYDYKVASFVCRGKWVLSGKCAAPAANGLDPITLSDQTNESYSINEYALKAYKFRTEGVLFGWEKIITDTHTHSVNRSHQHSVKTNNLNSGHNHNLTSKPDANTDSITLKSNFPAAESVSVANSAHIHKNAIHSHKLDTQPVFYKLAFIYLAGENE